MSHIIRIILRKHLTATLDQFNSSLLNKSINFFQKKILLTPDFWTIVYASMIPYSPPKKKIKIWSFNQYVGQEQTNIFSSLGDWKATDQWVFSFHRVCLICTETWSCGSCHEGTHIFTHAINPNIMHLNIETAIWSFLIKTLNKTGYNWSNNIYTVQN